MLPIFLMISFKKLIVLTLLQAMLVMIFFPAIAELDAIEAWICFPWHLMPKGADGSPCTFNVA